MKKILAVLLAALMLFTLAACGGNGDETTEPSADATTSAPAADEGKTEETKEIIARARARRESWLVRRMTSEPKLAQGCMNNLLQKKNGGFTNRPDNAQQSVEINVKIAGCDDFNAGA